MKLWHLLSLVTTQMMRGAFEYSVLSFCKVCPVLEKARTCGLLTCLTLCLSSNCSYSSIFSLSSCLSLSSSALRMASFSFRMASAPFCRANSAFFFVMSMFGSMLATTGCVLKVCVGVQWGSGSSRVSLGRGSLSWTRRLL